MSRDSIRARLEPMAEDGGWEAAEAISGDGLVVGGDGDAVATVFGNAAHLAAPEDRAAFIAAARQDIPALLAVADAAAECCRTSGLAGSLLARERLDAALDALETRP